MSKQRIIAVLLILVLLTVLIWLFWPDRTRFDWRETYREDSWEPYGTQVLYELLDDVGAGQPVIELSRGLAGFLPEDEPGPANYVFVGEALLLDSLDAETLLDFVRAGNRALISSRLIPYDLMYHLFAAECEDYYWDENQELLDTTAYLSLTNDTAGYTCLYLYRNEVQPYLWQYLGDLFSCSGSFSIQKTGYLNDSLINFVSIPLGGGLIYLHTTPLAFTNLSLLDEEGLAYAEGVFAELGPGPIYWDSYNRANERTGRRRSSLPPSERRLPENSPLQYILSQPPLAWAWYLLLSMGLLYLLFRAKRRQRIIPLSETNANTSLEFVATIGRLFFLQNNHRKLALQQMRLLQGFIRERYHLNPHKLDDAFAAQLAERANVDEERLRRLFLMHRNIENSTMVTENTLIDFHALIDYFYHHCK